MRPTTLAIAVFILVEVLLFGGMAYFLLTGHWIVALVLLLPAFALRITAMNDGPNGDWGWVILSLLHWEIMPPGKRPDK